MPRLGVQRAASHVDSVVLKYVITVDADRERIGEGELVMADGTRYPLDSN
jgi:hypothetical protein